MKAFCSLELGSTGSLTGQLWLSFDRRPAWLKKKRLAARAQHSEHRRIGRSSARSIAAGPSTSSTH